MKKLIEENEEKIAKIEKQIEDTSDDAIKEKLKKEQEELEEKNNNYRKQVEEYRDKMNEQINHLENRLR